jgi:hypothetical protein
METLVQTKTAKKQKMTEEAVKVRVGVFSLA